MLTPMRLKKFAQIQCIALTEKVVYVIAKMNQLQTPEFQTYEEEAAFWDNLDTADFMADDGEWFHFDTPQPRAVRIPLLPTIVDRLQKRAQAQGVSIETFANVILLESLQETTIVA